jgi:hypothetical protein
VLHLSKKEQEKWEEYASKHNLDVKKDVWSDKPRMTINWLRPFLDSTQIDYKIIRPKDKRQNISVSLEIEYLYNEVKSFIIFVSRMLCINIQPLCNLS